MVNHNSDDLWKKLMELEKTCIRITTSLEWMQKTASTTKSDDAITTKDLKDSIDKLHESLSKEIGDLSLRVSAIEHTNWYQKGFYAGLGAVFSLCVILIPNIDKVI